MRQTSYSAELKESIIRRLQGPSSPKISELSADTGISLSTLYQWRKQALSQNPGTPHDTSPHLRSAEEKWHLVKRAQERKRPDGIATHPVSVQVDNMIHCTSKKCFNIHLGHYCINGYTQLSYQI